MKVMNDKDLALMEALVKLTQEQLKATMKLYLEQNYTKVVNTSSYIYAIGDIPIALVAHLDTVFPFPPKDIYYDRKKGVLFAPEGAGFDDRAGIFGIIKLIQEGYRPHIIFTTDEEKGCLGARQLVLDLEAPFAMMKYIIELDRRGKDDCVFYDCANDDFVDYVETFGFKENYGTFSDISEICSAWMVAGVNLSIGYEDEHSVAEVLRVPHLYKTISRVKEMLDVAEKAPSFLYVPSKFAYNKWWKLVDNESPVPGALHCHKCKLDFDEYEMLPVKMLDGSTKFYCPDCMVTNPIQWCYRCCEACEVPPEEGDYYKDYLCEDCRKEVALGG